MKAEELVALVSRVFSPEGDERLGIMIDLPDDRRPDNSRWQARRVMAADWTAKLRAARPRLEATLLLYPNVHTNNADLPEHCFTHESGPIPTSASELDAAAAVPMTEIFDRFAILLALTELSSTAPLKVAARGHAFRAATMPGFTEEMIPALRLDYREVDRRVSILKTLLDRATGADLVFRHPQGEDRLHLDLRFRTGHASGGLIPTRGTAANLPSGEAYVVPYEGERPGEPSRSSGILPVQLEGEVVRYRVEENRATGVLSSGPESSRQAALLATEPAYANIAELGLGVLGAFGVQPVGAVLLDEKLGLHIAFGRSDHFGGQVGPSAFSSPEAVVHIDRVYVPGAQPDVHPVAVDLALDDGTTLALMRNGEYGPLF
jgi:hypothetical protein